MGSSGLRQAFVLSRVLITTAWLALAVAVVLWYRPGFWREPSDRPSDRFAEAQSLASRGEPAKALAAVNEALSGRSSEVGFVVFKGYRELDLARHDEAIASFRHALSLQPSSVEARLGLARALAGAHKRDEAISILEAMRASDLTARDLHRRSELYALLAAYELGLQDLTELLAASPNDRKLLDEALSLALASHDWNAAASLADRLASVTDDAALKRSAMSRRAMALRSLGRLNEAYGTYRQAADPDNLDARAELALQLEDFAAAIDLYRALAERRPDEVELRRRLAYALDRGARRREAEALYRSLVQQGGADTVTRVRYAWLLNSEGRYKEAWALIAPLPRPSTDPGLLELQARTAAWAGEAEESVPLLRALLDIRPSTPELWKLLAESYRTLGYEVSRAEALRSYVRLNSQDWKSRQELADVLARVGSVDAAIAEYQVLVAAHPRDSELLRALGLLLETSGRLREAIPFYRRAIESSPNPAPALLLRLARLYRWSSQPVDSVAWYQRYIAAVDDPLLARPANGELALALLESGDAAGGLSRIQDLARQAPLEPDNLLTGARAATAVGQPKLSVEYLEHLSEARPLAQAERVWLAGQLRAAGEAGRALALYEELAREYRGGDTAVLEAAADLRADRGAYREALEMYSRIPAAPAPVTLKIARAAAAAGSLDQASRAYTTYLSANTQDLEGGLEAARYFARTNQPQLALAAYQNVLAHRGPGGLRLELARVELEAEHFREAEHWARQALTEGENTTDATVALAESLHLQGRSAEARRILHESVQTIQTTASWPDALVWLGHAAVATDRQLEGFRAFDRALAAGAQPAGDLWLWRGQAAKKRGDLYRAEASDDHALAAGASAIDIRTARRDLRDASSPQLEAPVTLHADTNNLKLTEAGVTGAAYLGRNWARITAGVLQGRLRQHELSSSRTVGSLYLDRLFLIPELELQGGLGQERYGAAGDLTIGRIAASYAFSDPTRVGFSVSRESLLSARDGRDPREFNRIIDLAAVGPDFRLHRLEGFLDSAVMGDWRLRGTAGAEWYQDGNRRLFSYLHYEVPVKTGVRHWIVLRPNVYFESFRATHPAYFSPRGHFTLGTMFHSIFTFPRWTFEAEINPQILRTDGATGFGAHGVTSLTVRWGPVNVGGDTFIFYDGLEHYRHWRAGAHLIVPLRR